MVRESGQPTSVGSVKEQLLAWFGQSGKDLPWRETRILRHSRERGDAAADAGRPCHPALRRVARALADGRGARLGVPGEVIVAWQGLGYNRRAINLHRAARHVAEHGWPDDLTELPGVGPYTAAAVGNFAFGRDVLPVDVNIARVQERTGEQFDASCAQALFDLGATICLARIPRCELCPLADLCPSRGRRYEPLRKQSRFEGSFRQRRAQVAARGRRGRAAGRRRRARLARARRPRRAQGRRRVTAGLAPR